MDLYLSDFTELIKYLPYEQQSFETSKETWKNYKNHKIFSTFYNEVFKSENTMKFSRADLFYKAEGNFNDTIFKIILWGYPKGYTRPHTMQTLFPTFLDKGFSKLGEKLVPNGNYTKDDLKRMLHDIEGVGLSTLTKFLYFINCNVEGYKCVILDGRIIKVLQKKRFSELIELAKSKAKKDEYYISYIKLMNDLAKKNGYSVDQLELFLFMFGNNLKAS